MTITYLIDTDWIINYLCGQEQTVKRLKELRPYGIAVSVISLAELYEGVYHSKNPQNSQSGLDSFLEDITILGIHDDVCKIFGYERGRMRREGNIIGDFDLLIASTALHYNLSLITNNTRHFERVEGLGIISL
jgi:tRNA(fMet)-specific endonuclease VapC